jgi:SAM-dependent methyltransferase
VSAPLAAIQDLKLRYGVDLRALSPHLAERFIALAPNAETDAFLSEAARGRHSWWRTRAHRIVRQFVSDFDANGLLDMYPLFLAGTEHWRMLLGEEPAERLLDVGAGSGKVTRTLLPCAKHVVATELSAPMARGLRRAGIECHELDLADHDLPGQRFDLVSCLNVLDRTARPRRLLERLFRVLQPGGRLLLALALPYRPFFYVGARTPDPLERLACSGLDWEHAVSQLVERELEPLGLRLLSLSRTPYLSFGDAARGLYELDDAILVLQKPKITA